MAATMGMAAGMMIDRGLQGKTKRQRLWPLPLFVLMSAFPKYKSNSFQNGKDLSREGARLVKKGK
jgi:hypothetical protein